ncbi:hypothetical protein Q4Q49_06175 [Shewanella sp. SP1S1-7]|uniref:hypothetical protein n=1 Tax=Shewanella sp. SP1S1-7 TaxID=3063536 RepID=UPI00288F1201|nr:hypothetical protein [Shewanella sp. SP1S1-7]MDT3334881.1 hypothetical protein [Shewanella sp. SP1S1-7]
MVNFYQSKNSYGYPDFCLFIYSRESPNNWVKVFAGNNSEFEGLTMSRVNNTFLGAEPSWANACVGENGNPTYVQYAMGFSQAANLLIDQVLNDDIKYAVDDFIYPVCFNMRHSVELRLKGAISELQKLGEVARIRLEFDLIGSHDIGRIWEFFQTQSEKFDSRYEALNQKIAPTILDIAAIDATGQTFRYPVSTESQKHLADVGVISFFVLKERFNTLESHLDTLHKLNEFLVMEYKNRSFTKHLSRVQLFKIAKELPAIDEWSAEHFSVVRQSLKDKFGISSRELSDAINIIKGNYELAPLIGVTVNLHGISKDNLFSFITHWLSLHVDAKDKTIAGTTISSSDALGVFEHMVRSSEIKSNIWEDVSKWLTVEKLAGFQALFYFARDLDFSEQYTNTYEYLLLEAIAAQRQPTSFRQNFMHLLDKTNCFSHMLQSLYFLKYDELAKQLIKHFDWNGVFEWQERAETREMFVLPLYSQY